MPAPPPRAKAIAAVIALALLLILAAACGAGEVTIERSTSTPAPADPTPTAAPADTPAPTTPPPDTPAPTSPPVDTPAPTESPPAGPGSYEGVTYVVGQGSEATFTVEEKLSSLPLPNDAVLRTTALSGELHFDGRPSVIHIELHMLESDQSRRDRYVRERMFPNDPIATFTLPDARPLPDGFSDGVEVAAQITGSLEVKGVQAPVTFRIEARDDGDVVHILGRTTFLWSDFDIPPPNVGSFVKVTDEVAVEILISARPSGS